MASEKIYRSVNIDHVARIEGKAGIEVEISDEGVKNVKMNVIEGPRFFESIAVGKPVEEAVAVFPRICSFCAAAHKVTALTAAENAIGLTPSEQTIKLRELMYLGDQIESHALHLFLLAIPDYLGYPDAIAMTKEHLGAVATALELKDLGAHIQTVLGSRYIHQENALIGGFGKLPSKKELSNIAKMVKGLMKKSELAFELLMKIQKNWPEVALQRRHLAIKGWDGKYGIMGNVLVTSDGEEFSTSEYRERIKEFVVEHSFAKHSHYKGEMFMTSALSRYAVFGHLLDGRARELADEAKDMLDVNNPMANNFAQAIELVYFMERTLEFVLDLAENINTNEKRIKPVFSRPGSGFAITEAPRGIVAYNLKVNEKGIVTEADIVTPTAFFMGMMEDDVRRMAEALVNSGEKDPEVIGKKLEMIVRAYDPCVSCSVHVTHIR